MILEKYLKLGKTQKYNTSECYIEISKLVPSSGKTGSVVTLNLVGSYIDRCISSWDTPCILQGNENL